MGDVTLSAAVRSSLLSLESTTKLINQTQNRLSSGLEVSGAIDDPVKFFQAKTLSDRASDFDSKKDDIDQGISSVSAALDATEAVEDLTNQLKGLALSAKSATSSQIADLVTQFNDLRTQIDNLTSDAQYQGLNLVNGSGQSLTVQFSTDTASTLTVSSVDITVGPDGLAINKAVAGGTFGDSTLDVSYGAITDATLTAGETFDITIAASADITVTTAADYTFSYGGQTLTLTTTSVGGTSSLNSGDVLSAGKAYTVTVATALDSGADNAVLTGLTGGGTTTITALDGQSVFSADISSEINSLITGLDTALTTLRTKGQTLGSNVALLQTRFEFTETYVNTLQAGSDKLTLANLNEEGANLLALQTRQQLGISALSFAGQAEQGILGLFR